MKKIAVSLAASFILISGAAMAQQTATPATGPNSPTLTNNASDVGTERASRNTPGGDRANGGFGQAQSDYVQSLKGTGTNYGEALHEFCGGTNCGNSTK